MRRRRVRKRQEKRENSRPISKRLRAALFWSLRGQYCEKMVYERGVPGVTVALGKANSHFDQRLESRTARPRYGHCRLAQKNLFIDFINFFTNYIVIKKEVRSRM